MNAVPEYQILIVNGPNLGFIGSRESRIYGTRKIQEIPGILRDKDRQLFSRITLEFFQANGEGAIIDRLEKAWQDEVNGIVINPGAYTHTSLALADCLAWIKIPYVEVHLSNIWSRDKIRNQSLTAAHSVGMVAGFGVMSYVYGLQALADFLDTGNILLEDK